ncbi:MAG: hypothetical protein JXR50_11355 [Prolixibacteraceae bacterium]|nr:hypothetical protein [Prolixibacteraceae bacterium]MBN2650325.1 hypothetical protein [Prolixibacteraceae bacterium]
MKKYYAAITLALLILSSVSFAQVHSQTIGARLGGGSFSSGEFTYQKGMSNENRVELDLGFGANINHNRLYAVGAYHWVWNISGDLNWYAGPAVSAGLFSYKNEDSYLNVALGGQVGIEYDFTNLDVPLLLSLDARPMWDFIGSHSGLGWGTALGIRYIF